MAFVQVSPEKRAERRAQPTAPTTTQTTEDEPMEVGVGAGRIGMSGGGWGRGNSGQSSDLLTTKRGAGPASPEHGVHLDLTVEEPGDPSAGIGDREQGCFDEIEYTYCAICRVRR
jgi:hypothetical protein